MADIAIHVMPEHYSSPQVHDYIRSHNASTFYHLPEWSDLLQVAFHYTPSHLIAWQNQTIVGLLPLFEIRTLLGGHRFACLPFSHAVGPIADNDDIYMALVEHAASIAFSKKASYLLIKDKSSYDTHTHNRQYPFLTSVLEVDSDPEALWRNIKNAARRNIRKAEKSGVSIIDANHPKYFHTFNKLMYETRRRQGVPGYPLSYFDKLWECLNQSSAIQLYIALLDKQPVAGIMLGHHHDTAIYLYGASLGSPQILRARPNDLLFWHAINEARNRGSRRFDFGLTHVGNAGLLRFKEGWGARSEPVVYQHITRNKHTGTGHKRDSTGMKVASWCLRHTPTPLFKIISSLVIRQFG